MILVCRCCIIKYKYYLFHILLGGFPMSGHLLEYYKSVCEAHRLGNIESSYNAPIIVLLTQFGCVNCTCCSSKSRWSLVNTPEDMEIGSIKYKDGVLHLNANKRILGISADVWDYRIGGYQVLDKWFKSHKGEALTIDSFEHIL